MKKVLVLLLSAMLMCSAACSADTAKNSGDASGSGKTDSPDKAILAPTG